MSEMIGVRASMREELDMAIRDHELGLALQPLVDARAGDLASVEPLLRWPRCSRGDISPADLIPMAEESGPILQPGEWVLDRALKIARELNDVAVAVHVSPIQFTHHGLPCRVSEQLLAACTVRASGRDRICPEG